MSNQHSHGLDQSIGQQWVELSRDHKKKICDALIDRNETDVMQEFTSLVRFTRGYLHQQPVGSLSSPNSTSSVLIPSISDSQPSENRIEKRENDEENVDVPSIPRKKAKAAVKYEKMPVNRALKGSHSDDEVVKRRA